MYPTLIYQDDNILVLDKPSGLLVHSVEAPNIPAARAKYADEVTLADWLLEKFPQAGGTGEEGRFGIVHRLDRETSGIIIAALTPSAYVRLKKQFARREIHKTYRAFVYGAIKEERGVIERAIGRSATGNRSAKLPADSEEKTREAQTTFKTLERATLASYLELYPATGRTHQIRAHLSALQHPVVCDGRYAPRRPAILALTRLALHAFKISFTHPATGKQISFEAPLPPDFLEAEHLLQHSIGMPL